MHSSSAAPNALDLPVLLASALTWLRHPEAPAQHTTRDCDLRLHARASDAALEIAARSHAETAGGRRPSRLARPEEAGRAPQGDGEIAVFVMATDEAQQDGLTPPGHRFAVPPCART